MAVSTLNASGFEEECSADCSVTGDGQNLLWLDGGSKSFDPLVVGEKTFEEVADSDIGVVATGRDDPASQLGREWSFGVVNGQCELQGATCRGQQRVYSVLLFVGLQAGPF